MFRLHLGVRGKTNFSSFEWELTEQRTCSGKLCSEKGMWSRDGSGTGFPSGKQLAVRTQHRPHHHNELGITGVTAGH